MIVKPSSTFSSIFRAKKSRKWKREMTMSTLLLMRKNLHKAARQSIFRRKFGKPRNSHRNRGFAIEELAFVKSRPSLFKSMFRLDVESFDELVERLDPLLKKDTKFSILSSGSAISTQTRLAVTLRWLAGGSYIDLCFAWGLSFSTFFSERGVLWPTIEALDSLFSLGLPLDKPEVLEELSNGFRDHSGGVMDGCILAIDGLAVRVRQPYKSEAKYTKCWRSRKGGFALVVMAGSDVNGKLWTVTAKDSGSTHDSQVWNNSALADCMQKGELPSKYFIIGDEAFSNTQQLLTPYPGRGLGEWKDSFNYWLSHSRQCIERAFGMLVQRWGIFWRKFIFSFDRWPLVITVCCKLHNFCVDRFVEIPTRRFSEDHVSGDCCVVLDNNDDAEDRRMRLYPRGERRDQIRDLLENEGRRRPPHAISNNKI